MSQVAGTEFEQSAVLGGGSQIWYMLPLSPPLSDEESAISGLDHAVVRSADPEASKALYGEGLGLRCALDREFPKWGSRLIFFRVGGVTVEVAASLVEGGAGGEPGSQRDELWVNVVRDKLLFSLMKKEFLVHAPDVLEEVFRDYFSVKRDPSALDEFFNEDFGERRLSAAG